MSLPLNSKKVYQSLNGTGIDIDGNLHTPVGAVGIDFDCSASFSETIKICAHITTEDIEIIGGTNTGCALDVTAGGKSLDFSNSGGTDVDVSLCVRMSPINNMTGVEMHVKAYGHLGFSGAFNATKTSGKTSAEYRL